MTEPACCGESRLDRPTERLVAVDDSEIRPRGAVRAASHPRKRMCVSTATTAAASRTRTTSTVHCHAVQGHASLSLMELTLAPGRAAFLASRSRCDSTPLPVCNRELRHDECHHHVFLPRGEVNAQSAADPCSGQRQVRGPCRGGPRTAGSHRGGGALEDSWQPPHDGADPCSGAPCTWVPRPRRGRDQSRSPRRQPPTRLRHW